MATWLKDLRARVDESDDEVITIAREELREIVTCGVADRRLRLLAEDGLTGNVTIKRRTASELIRSCRWQRTVEIRRQRARE